MPIWADDADGTGEYEIDKVFADDADGTGEYEIGKIYADDADGNGEYLLWEAVQWIDNLNDADLAEYMHDTGYFTPVTSPVFEGSHALRFDQSSSGVKGITSFAGDGLDNYIDQGDTFQFRFRTTNDSASSTKCRPGIAYAIPSGSEAGYDGYTINFYADEGDMSILKAQNNSRSFLLDIDISSYTAGEWWTCRGQWKTDDTHVIEVYDNTGSFVNSGSVVDSTFSGNNGTFGWFGYVASGEYGYTDAAKLI